MKSNDHRSACLLCGLEADSSLFLPGQLRERLIALDDLDAGFGGFGSEDSTSDRIHACISVRRRSGYDSKPRTQNSTSLCALILFATVNPARFFSGSRIQRPITSREAPCRAWASTTETS